MWPWGHLAFGYLLYSGTVHLLSGDSPTTSPVAVLALATQLPDLVDKPLAWGLGVLPHGLSLAHSVFFAVPFLLLCLGAAHRRGVPEYGVAMCVGYLSHLLGDALYGVLTGGDLSFLLWPLIEQPSEASAGLFSRTAELFRAFVSSFATSAGLTYLVVSVLTVSLTAALWVYDGCPGMSLLWDATRRHHER